ncbi:MAG: GIY-YIG nuclease family protein [Candidatus Muirbacterium halophilum]|nr:GIY-YIG nuclease family protein [Candidatus Muirbacterium halophilum]MCK9477334.1 GIY-YIG nuclease family protein [Candidatus Muirbacterium halophilum]
MATAKTIQIFLPDGNPVGVKKIEITSRTIKGIYIPRAKFESADSIPELKKPGVYFLIGGEDNEECYIGESENCYDRLKHHNNKKDFWNKAIIFVSKVDDGFMKSHVKYLEHIMIKMATECDRYTIVNSNTTKESVIPETIKTDIDDYFNDIRLLLSTLGFSVFEKAVKDSNSTNSSDILYCKCKNALASGEYTEEGLVVLKGSTITDYITESAHDFIKKTRDKLIQKEILKKEKNDNLYHFTKDYIFSSPSTAAGVIRGSNSNGWIEWKNKDGKKLKEIISK